MPKKTDVWVFAEQKAGEIDRVSLEVMCAASALAEKLGGGADAVMIGYRTEHIASILGYYGARKAYIVDDILLDQYNADAYVSAFVDLITDYSPSVLLLGSTSTGRDLAPRLAVRLGASFVADCIALNINEVGCLTGTKPIFARRQCATIVCTSTTLQIATVLPGVMEIREPDSSKKVEIVRFRPGLKLEAIRTENVGFIRADPRTMDLTEAEIIVAGGRGVGDRENFQLIQQLADILGGAVGGTRPAVDSEWIPYERQIGLTGKTVAPKLLISCGISGQYSHNVGTEGASVKIAINTDPNAPIFNLADLGIVGDLREVIPALIKELGKTARI